MVRTVSEIKTLEDKILQTLENSKKSAISKKLLNLIPSVSHLTQAAI